MNERRYIGKSATEEALEKIEFTSEKVLEISTKIADEYSLELDELIVKIKSRILNISNAELEEYILDLAQCLYFTGAAQEDLGIKEDTSKAIKTEIYNNAKKSTKGTVADKEAAAVLASQQQSIVNSIYNRAYRKLKFKVDAGYEVLTSLKKIMTKRISEAELSNSRFIGNVPNEAEGEYYE